MSQTANPQTSETDMDTTALDNFAKSRYGHNLPARVDVQESPTSEAFPAMGVQPANVRSELEQSLDNFTKNRYGHNLPKGAK